MKRVIMPVQQAQCGRLVLVNDKHGLNGVSVFIRERIIRVTATA